MPNGVPDTLIEKIQKLMALQSGATTEHEAANAAARIQEMLTKYNLEMHQIESHQSKKSDPIERTDLDLNPYSGKSDSDWVLRLLNAICRTNFCRLVEIKNGTLKGKGAIVGKVENATVAIMMLDYLVPEIKRLASQYWASYDGYEKKNAFKRGFYRGCVAVIRQRLFEQMEQSKAEVVGVTALVVQTDNQLQIRMQEIFPRLATAPKASSLSGNDGRYHGNLAGSKIGLNKQVSNSSSNRGMLN